jgi:hypothetical protein
MDRAVCLDRRALNGAVAVEDRHGPGSETNVQILISCNTDQQVLGIDEQTASRNTPPVIKCNCRRGSGVERFQV